MALTKVSRGLLSTGIVDNSNATAITLNADESATFSGSVGIGTSSSNAVLHLGSASAVGNATNPALQFGGTTTYRLGMYTDAEGGYIENKNGDNGLIFRVKTVGEAMQIDGGTGNLLVGSSVATGARLSVIDSSVASKQIVFSNNATYYGSVGHNAGTGYNEYRTEANGMHAFFRGTSTTADALITSAGKIVVNGTVAGYSGTDITVGSPSQGSAGLSILSSTTGYGYLLFGDATGDSTAGYSGQINYSHSTNRMGFNTNNAERLAINNVGAIFATGVRSSSAANNDLRYNTSNGEIYYQTSSERYKSNIVDLEFDTSNLYNLRPVSFDDNETGERCFGLIAEDTFEKIPEVVVSRNIDGETVPDSIPYSMLSVVIINEMKKLKVENDLLKERLTALENNS